MSTMNRMGNAGNKFQTAAKRVLCVCSAGLLRSPTTANVLWKEYGYNTRAAGASQSYALVQVDEVLLHWADEIVFVEKSVYDEVCYNFPKLMNGGTVRSVVLGIPDNYMWGDEELQAIILKQYEDSKIMERAL